MTSPNPDWALIIHADSADTRIDIYWVDIRAGRLGLALAREVKAWRKRDDLLTLGQRFTVVAPPVQTVSAHIDASDEWVDAITELAQSVPVPDRNEAPDESRDPVATPLPSTDVPASVPVVPGERRREDSRIEYLRGRVRAVLEHSAIAGKALQRLWPTGVPGLKIGGHSMGQLDSITGAIERAEKDHSVPWFPMWNDPAIEDSKITHPSNIWSRPKLAKPTEEDRLNIQQALATHERGNLVRDWIGIAISGGIDSAVDTTALAHALFEWAKLDATEWPDADLTTMLDGSMRALGYPNGVLELGRFNPDHAPLLMSAAFAIVAGNATLMFDDKERPVVRVVKGKK